MLDGWMDGRIDDGLVESVFQGKTVLHKRSLITSIIYVLKNTKIHTHETQHMFMRVNVKKLKFKFLKPMQPML